MNAPSDDLKSITAPTLAHYDENAVEYAERTSDHDVGQNIMTLLRYIDGDAPFTLLDFGCGPGRDLRTLAATGHTVVGLDGSSAFVTMAHDATGCTVLHQDFLALDLPDADFDGIFANASMQHIPSRELPRVLKQLHAALKPRGVLLASIPHGHDEEGWNGARYSAFHEPATWQRYLADAGFVEIEHYFRPAGLPCEDQRWLASAWRKA